MIDHSWGKFVVLGLFVRSQEVVCLRLLARHAPALLRRRLEDGELSLEVLVELEDGGDVATAVAVVWRRPDGQHGLAKVPLVALHDKLVRATDHLNVVRLVELRHHV